MVISKTFRTFVPLNNEIMENITTMAAESAVPHPMKSYKDVTRTCSYVTLFCNQKESSKILDVVKIDEVDNRCLWERLVFKMQGWLL